MRKITLSLLLLVFGLSAYPQSVSDYLFTESTEMYSAVNGTNSTATGDDGMQNDIAIGFPFAFGGVDYTTFSISTNGFIRLGNAIGGGSWTNELSNAAVHAPLIAAFWDDNNRTTGSIQYTVSGTQPNRTLEVGWDNVNIGGGGSTSTTAFASFKMRLYETTGQIDFIYSTMMNTGGTLSASIGVNDMTSFLSATPASGSASASSAVANNTINSTASVVNRKYSFIPQSVCSGTPNPGNALSSSATVCPGQGFILTLQNTGNGYGLVYQWQSSSDGITFTDIPNSDTAALDISQDVQTYYQCIVACGSASVISAPVVVGMNPALSCYCAPSYTTGKTDGDLISNVSITGTTLSNNTGTDPVNPYYTYFTGQPNFTAALQAGSTYDINVTVGSYGAQNSAVWIDYNDDGSFSMDERVGYSQVAMNSFATGVYPIVISCDPPAGVHRMRIRDVWNTPGISIDPCANYGYGETEDYDITIMAPTSCPMPVNPVAALVNATSAELQWSTACGQVSWDIHVTVAGGGIPTGIPSNPSLDDTSLIVGGLTPLTAYEFYVRANCDAIGDSGWAGPFSFTTTAPAIANDECENAFVLTSGTSFSEYALTATNDGASQSLGAPSPTCAVFGFGGDVWFSVIVPASGTLTIETQPEPGSPLIDTGMTVFSGDCASFTTLGCSDDEGVAAFSMLTLTGLTPGMTVYARVWEYANDTIGSFRVSAYDSSLGTGSFGMSGLTSYPNPVRDVLNISVDTEISGVQVFNMLGQQVLAKSMHANSGQVEMASLPAGTYVVKVFSGDSSKTIKVIKQ
jgi:hypothetical protein